MAGPSLGAVTRGGPCPQSDQGAGGIRSHVPALSLPCQLVGFGVLTVGYILWPPAQWMGPGGTGTLLVLGLGGTRPHPHPHLHRCPLSAGTGKAAQPWHWGEQSGSRATSQIQSVCPLQGERGPPGQSVPGARGVPGIPGERGEQVGDRVPGPAWSSHSRGQPPTSLLLVPRAVLAPRGSVGRRGSRP